MLLGCHKCCWVAKCLEKLFYERPFVQNIGPFRPFKRNLEHIMAFQHDTEVSCVRKLFGGPYFVLRRTQIYFRYFEVNDKELKFFRSYFYIPPYFFLPYVQTKKNWFCSLQWRANFYYSAKEKNFSEIYRNH